MRLALFGATGRTGQHVLAQALAAGHEITVLVRDPAKIETQNGHLKVLAGDVRDSARVEEAVRGAEAVVSVLGPTRNEPVFEISAGTANILAAMQKNGPRRLIVSVGAGVADPEDAPGVFHHAMNFLVRRLARYIYEDMAQVAAEVRATDLDWTIVRVPMLTDGAHTGEVKAGYVGKGMGPRMSRADMADFMLKQLTDETYVRKAPAISN